MKSNIYLRMEITYDERISHKLHVVWTWSRDYLSCWFPKETIVKGINKIDRRMKGLYDGTKNKHAYIELIYLQMQQFFPLIHGPGTDGTCALNQ